MLITLGLGSASGMISNIITVMCDMAPLRSRLVITAIVSVTGFLTGLLYVTPSGQALLDLVDYYGGSLLILVLALLEVIGVSWVYGVNNIIRDLNSMMKTSLGWYWRLCWGAVTPIALTLILLYSFIDYSPVTFNGQPLPTWMQVLGWVTTIAGLMFVPAVIFYQSWRNGFKEAFNSKGWRPLKDEDYEYWQNPKPEIVAFIGTNDEDHEGDDEKSKETKETFEMQQNIFPRIDPDVEDMRNI